jgi:hypothetical protein
MDNCAERHEESASREKTEKLVKEILSMPSDVKQGLAFLVRRKGT